MPKEKEYGLILPSSKKPIISVPKKKNIFGDDSDEEQADIDWVKQTKKAHGSIQQKQSTLVMKKALAEDPSIYQYDEHYDSMEKERSEVLQKQKGSKQPKYITHLLKAAEQRTRENEQRIEREVQREREAEHGKYSDKEVFVTGAYRKKMEEAQKLQEEQDRKDAIDDLVDVTKQKDMSGFYRHLYRQTVNKDSSTSENKEPILPDTTSESDISKQTSESRPRSKMDTPEDTEADVNRKFHDDSEKYRRDKHRRRSPESNHRSRNRRSRSRSRSRSNERTRKQYRDSRYFDKQPKQYREERSPDSKTRSYTEKRADSELSNKGSDFESSTVKDNGTKELPQRSEIWTKRTVGVVFKDALERYYNRKQENSVNATTIVS